MIHAAEVNIHAHKSIGCQELFNQYHHIVLPFRLLATDDYHIGVLQVNFPEERSRVLLKYLLILLGQVPRNHRDIEVLFPLTGVGH